MAAPYTWLDDARTTAASPRSIGGPTLVLANGSKFGAPSPSAPLQVAIRRSNALVVVLLATARSGSSLTISGPAPGYSDAAVQAGDDVLVGPTAADMAAIWAAIDGKQGSLTLTTTGSSGAATLVGSTLNIPQYSGGGGSGTVTSVSVATANGFAGSVATPTTTPAITLSTNVTGLLKGDGTGVSAATPGTDYLTGNQAITLGGDLSGSGATSITATIASNAVTTAKVNNNAVTYAKMQTAASAGIIGASTAGNYGHVTIGAGLSLSGGVLSSTISGTVTSVGLTVPTGLSVSGSPVTGSGTLAVTLGVSGLLKGSAGAIVAAAAGTDYVSPSGLTSALASYVTLTGAQTLYDKSTQSSGSGDQLKFNNTLGVQASGVDADGNEGAYDLSFLLAAGVDLIAGASASQTARWPGKIAEILIKANVNGASGGFTLKIVKNGSTIATQAVAASNTSVVTIASGSISDLAIAKSDVFAATCESSPAPGTGVQSVEVYIKHARRNR